jgi:hypothetical protein
VLVLVLVLVPVSPGSPGRLPAPSPHRSGRAGFPHPVLRATGSLQIRDHMSSRIRTHPALAIQPFRQGVGELLVSPPAFLAESMARLPSFLCGVPRGGSPTSSVISRSYDSPRPSRGTSVVPRAPVPSVRSMFAPAFGERALAGRGFVSGSPHPVASTNGDVGPPRFLENPCISALL